MAIQQRNSEMVNLLKADFVHKADSLWANGPQVRRVIADGQTLTIFGNYQYIVADRFEVIGTVDVQGDLVII